MAKFIAELLWLVGLVIGLIAVVLVTGVFLYVVNWLLGKIKKLKGKE
jgi:Flp pilus assembly pilin Flp